MEKQRNFICTRPILARKLMDAGQQATPIVNPWEPQRTAWLFPVSGTLTVIVSAFYQSIGKKLPAVLLSGKGETV